MVGDFDSLDGQFEGCRQGRSMVRLHLEMSTLEGREGRGRQLSSRGELGLGEAYPYAQVEKLEVIIFERNELGDWDTEDTGRTGQSVDLGCYFADLPGAHSADADVGKPGEFAARQARIATGPSKAFRVEPAQDLATHTRSLVRRAPFTRSHCAALTSVGVSMMFYIDIVDRESLA